MPQLPFRDALENWTTAGRYVHRILTADSEIVQLCDVSQVYSSAGTIISCKLATIITDTTDYIQLMCTNLHSLAAYARDQLYAHRDTANVRVREVNITLVLRK